MSIYIMAGFLFAVATRSFAAWADANSLAVGLSQNQYLGEKQAPEQKSQYTFLSADLVFVPQTTNVDFKLDILADGALNAQNEFYFGVPEAFVHPKGLADDFDITVGRQKRHWSHLDEEFNLGVWQPQLRWDYLRPEQEGLLGVFIDVQLTSRLKLTLLSSPVFLPDQGPNYQLKQGTFSSANRWFVPPQSRLSLFQGTPYAKDAPLSFELDRPTDEKFIMHSTIGGALSLAGEGPWWANLAYAFKPRNQIHLGIECTNCFNISGPTPGEITAVVHPVTVMHNVATFETGYKSHDDDAWISLTYDKPSASDLPANYEESPLDTMVIYGGGYQHFLDFSQLPRSWVKLSYMQVVTVEKTDRQGLVDSDQVQSSLDRYPYEKLAAFEWRVLLHNQPKSRVEFDARYSYSFPEQGGWLEAGLVYAQNSFTYSLGLDILGSSVDPTSADAGLFTRYRTNDRVYAGVGYVF